MTMRRTNVRRTSARGIAALLLAAGTIIFSAACIQDDSLKGTTTIVTTIPWTAPESYRYVLVDDDGKEQGRGTLSVTSEDGRLLLAQRFSDGDRNADEALLTVDAETLQPVSGRRTIRDEDRRAVAETQYGPLDDGSYGVRITQSNFSPPDEAEPDSTRSNPLKVPEHAYDNDSSLFLWRTIGFEKGKKYVYGAVIANRRAKRAVTLHVRREERVETPAGEFDAWFVTIEAEGQSHEAWFATTPDHKLLKYDNDRNVFLYEGEGE